MQFLAAEPIQVRLGQRAAPVQQIAEQVMLVRRRDRLAPIYKYRHVAGWVISEALSVHAISSPDAKRNSPAESSGLART